MRKLNIITIVSMIFVLGISTSVLLSFLNKHDEINITECRSELEFTNISSNLDTVDMITEEEKISEAFDKSQMYFENIQVLYEIFSYSQVEDIKEEIRLFIQNSINKDILNCTIISKTISKVNKMVVIDAVLVDNIKIEVTIHLNTKNNIESIETVVK